MLDVILDSCLDILKTAPILLAVYLLIELLERKMNRTPLFARGAQRLGPLIGALAGSVPQCGFSAASATLYGRGFLASSTLIAVFLATSDEAIPLMLSYRGNMYNVVRLIIWKIIIAVIAGYLFKWTIFRNEKHAQETSDAPAVHCHACDCGCGSLLGSAVIRTVKTSLFLLISLLAINYTVYLIGEAAMSRLLMGGSVLQPAVCALIGLIPGCAISVFLTELFLHGTISFGAAIAGLSTGAGFGYILLFQQTKDRKKAFLIIGLTYAAAVVAGTILQFML